MQTKRVLPMHHFVIAELAANDYLIERMQVDIRRKHDEIERKQKNLDKLNRQYDECLVQQGGESSVCAWDV